VKRAQGNMGNMGKEEKQLMSEVTIHTVLRLAEENPQSLSILIG